MVQARAGKLWSQIEATFKQMGTAATELECFQDLQKQELSAAAYRINNLIEEINKQKAQEQTLQHRYGSLLADYERIQGLLEEHKRQIKIQEEIAAQNRAREEEIASKNHIEEEIAAMNRAIDEDVTDNNSAHEDQMAVETSNLDGQSETVELAPGDQLNVKALVDNDIVECQSASGADMISEDMNDNKEPVELANVADGIVDEDNMVTDEKMGVTENNPVEANVSVQTPTKYDNADPSTDEQAVIDSGEQMVADSLIKENTESVAVIDSSFISVEGENTSDGQVSMSDPNGVTAESDATRTVSLGKCDS